MEPAETVANGAYVPGVPLDVLRDITITSLVVIAVLVTEPTPDANVTVPDLALEPPLRENVEPINETAVKLPEPSDVISPLSNELDPAICRL